MPATSGSAPNRRTRDPNEMFTQLGPTPNSANKAPDKSGSGILRSLTKKVGEAVKEAMKPEDEKPLRFADLDRRLQQAQLRQMKEGIPPGERIQLGPRLGDYDTPNIRERIRRWQQTGGGVVDGDDLPLPPPPIIPIASRGPSSIASSGGRPEWETASEAEKSEMEMERMRETRERKMRRRSRGPARATEDRPRSESGKDPKDSKDAKPQRAKTIVVEDGIRITPMKKKKTVKRKVRRGSNGSRASNASTEKDKEKEEKALVLVGETALALPGDIDNTTTVPTLDPGKDPLSVDVERFLITDKEDPPPATPVETPKVRDESVRIYDEGDGIRVIAKKKKKKRKSNDEQDVSPSNKADTATEKDALATAAIDTSKVDDVAIVASSTEVVVPAETPSSPVPTGLVDMSGWVPPQEPYRVKASAIADGAAKREARQTGTLDGQSSRTAEVLARAEAKREALAARARGVNVRGPREYTGPVRVKDKTLKREEHAPLKGPREPTAPSDKPKENTKAETVVPVSSGTKSTLSTSSSAFLSTTSSKTQSAPLRRGATTAGNAGKKVEVKPWEAVVVSSLRRNVSLPKKPAEKRSESPIKPSDASIYKPKEEPRKVSPAPEIKRAATKKSKPEEPLQRPSEPPAPAKSPVDSKHESSRFKSNSSPKLANEKSSTTTRPASPKRSPRSSPKPTNSDAITQLSPSPKPSANVSVASAAAHAFTVSKTETADEATHKDDTKRTENKSVVSVAASTASSRPPPKRIVVKRPNKTDEEILAERRKATDEAIARRFLQEQEEARKRVEEESAREAAKLKQQAEAAKAKAAEELAAKRKAAEEASRKKKEEEERARKKKAEEEAAARKKRAEEEAAARKKRAEEEAAARKKRAEEAAAKRKALEEAAAKKRAAEKAAREKRKAEEEAAAKKRAAEEKRKAAEEAEAKRKAAEAAAARRKAKDEAAAKRRSAEIEKRKLADAAAKKKLEEELEVKKKTSRRSLEKRKSVKGRSSKEKVDEKTTAKDRDDSASSASTVTEKAYRRKSKTRAKSSSSSSSSSTSSSSSISSSSTRSVRRKKKKAKKAKKAEKRRAPSEHSDQESESGSIRSTAQNRSDSGSSANAPKKKRSISSISASYSYDSLDFSSGLDDGKDDKIELVINGKAIRGLPAEEQEVLDDDDYESFRYPPGTGKILSEIPEEPSVLASVVDDKPKSPEPEQKDASETENVPIPPGQPLRRFATIKDAKPMKMEKRVKNWAKKVTQYPDWTGPFPDPEPIPHGYADEPCRAPDQELVDTLERALTQGKRHTKPHRANHQRHLALHGQLNKSKATKPDNRDDVPKSPTSGPKTKLASFIKAFKNEFMGIPHDLTDSEETASVTEDCSECANCVECMLASVNITGEDLDALAQEVPPKPPAPLPQRSIRSSPVPPRPTRNSTEIEPTPEEITPQEVEEKSRSETPKTVEAAPLEKEADSSEPKTEVDAKEVNANVPVEEPVTKDADLQGSLTRNTSGTATTAVTNHFSDENAKVEDSPLTSSENIPSQRDTPRPEEAVAEVTPAEDNPTRMSSLASSQAQTDSAMTEASISRPPLHRNLTSHADLVSLLSSSGCPRAKSIRTRKKPKRIVQTVSITDLMVSLVMEEKRYMRELRTLVEDVIPVLVSTVLERTDDDIARRLCASPGDRNSRVTHSTRSIMDLGIALERLKIVHERLPSDSEEGLLIWAEDARRVYTEYLKVWRMGYQDIVVTLVPDETFSGEEDTLEATTRDLEAQLNMLSQSGTPISFAEGRDKRPPMPLNLVFDKDCERVDVAFLLKRPLVRLRVLAKLFKRIKYTRPTPRAEVVCSQFHDLVDIARIRISSEKQRIENEAAALIATDQVLVMRTWEPVEPFILDSRGKDVRARDEFKLKMVHSSTGQMFSRDIELILRERVANQTTPAMKEVLFATVVTADTGAVKKVLMFHPIPTGLISARWSSRSDLDLLIQYKETVDGSEWTQIMRLTAAEKEIVADWENMLGLNEHIPEVDFEDEPRFQEIETPELERVLEMEEALVVAPSANPETKSEVMVSKEDDRDQPVAETLSRIASPGLKRSRAVSRNSRPKSMSSLKSDLSGASGGTAKPDEKVMDLKHKTPEPTAGEMSLPPMGTPPSREPNFEVVEMKPDEQPKEEKPVSKPPSPVSSPTLPRSSGPTQRAVSMPSTPSSPAKKPLNISTPPILVPSKRAGVQRRTSSPLKHEYAPSTPSASASGSSITCDDPDCSECQYCSCSDCQNESQYETESESEIEDDQDRRSSAQERPQSVEYPSPVLEIHSNLQRKPSVISLAKSVRSIKDEKVITQTATPASVTPTPVAPVLPPLRPFNAICRVYRWQNGIFDLVHNDPLRLVITRGRVEIFEPPFFLPQNLSPSLSQSGTTTPTTAADGATTTTPTGVSTPTGASEEQRQTPRYSFELNHIVRVEHRHTANDCYVSNIKNSGELGQSIMFRCQMCWDRDALMHAFQRAIPPGPLRQLSPANGSERSADSKVRFEETVEKKDNIKRGWASLGRARSFRSAKSKPSLASSNGSNKSFASLKSFFKRPFGSTNNSASQDATSSGGLFGRKKIVDFIDKDLGPPMIPSMHVELMRKDGGSWERLGSGQLGLFQAPSGDPNFRRVIIQSKVPTIIFDECIEVQMFQPMYNKGVSVRVNNKTLGEETGRRTGKSLMTFCFAFKYDREASFLLTAVKHQ